MAAARTRLCWANDTGLTGGGTGVEPRTEVITKFKGAWEDAEAGRRVREAVNAIVSDQSIFFSKVRCLKIMDPAAQLKENQIYTTAKKRKPNLY